MQTVPLLNPPRSLNRKTKFIKIEAENFSKQTYSADCGWGCELAYWAAIAVVIV
jgi:hypothetical protein